MHSIQDPGELGSTRPESRFVPIQVAPALPELTLETPEVGPFRKISQYFVTDEPFDEKDLETCLAVSLV